MDDEPWRLVEFEFGWGLVFAYLAGGDVGCVVILTTNGDPGESAEHRELADVIECIGDGTLEKLFRGDVELRVAGKIVVETLQRVEETLDFIGPWQRRGIVPGGFAFGHGERPIE